MISLPAICMIVDLYHFIILCFVCILFASSCIVFVFVSLKQQVVSSFNWFLWLFIDGG